MISGTNTHGFGNEWIRKRRKKRRARMGRKRFASRRRRRSGEVYRAGNEEESEGMSHGRKFSSSEIGNGTVLRVHNLAIPLDPRSC